MKIRKAWIAWVASTASASQSNRASPPQIQTREEISDGRREMQPNEDPEGLSHPLLEEEYEGSRSNSNLRLLSEAACGLNYLNEGGEEEEDEGVLESEEEDEKEGLKGIERFGGETDHESQIDSSPLHQGENERWVGEERVKPLKKRIIIQDSTSPEEQATAAKEKKADERGATRRGRGRGRGSLTKASQCSRVNGRGWRCGQLTLVGYSLCEHHLGKSRMKSLMNRLGGRNDAATREPNNQNQIDNHHVEVNNNNNNNNNKGDSSIYADKEEREEGEITPDDEEKPKGSRARNRRGRKKTESSCLLEEFLDRSDGVLNSSSRSLRINPTSRPVETRKNTNCYYYY